EGGRAVMVEANAEHPILNSVESFYTPSDIYGIVNLDQDKATVLMRGQILKHLDPAAPPVTDGRNDPMMPMAWVKDYHIEGGKPGRVFTTTAGASVDFRSEDLRRLLVNASHDLLDLDVPDAANVTTVDPYDPSFYGFLSGDVYLDRGMRVEDFQLGSSASIAETPTLNQPPDMSKPTTR
ncbi:MAG: hypothetical protein AAF539_00895, partial [Planctomycetota bacterium]